MIQLEGGVLLICIVCGEPTPDEMDQASYRKDAHGVKLQMLAMRNPVPSSFHAFRKSERRFSTVDRFCGIVVTNEHGESTRNDPGFHLYVFPSRWLEVGITTGKLVVSGEFMGRHDMT